MRPGFGPIRPRRAVIALTYSPPMARCAALFRGKDSDLNAQKREFFSPDS